MGNYSLRDIVTILLKNEKSTAELYLHLSSRVEDEEGKKLFKSLASDEMEHYRNYSQMLEDINEHPIELSEKDNNYVDLLLKRDIFSDFPEVSELADFDFTTASALHLAEKIERDEIFYLLELKDLFPDQVMPRLERILDQERKHLKSVIPGGKHYPWFDRLFREK